MKEPVKYIFIISPVDNTYIVKIKPIAFTGFDKDGNPRVFDFISQEKFQDVIGFHQATDNHCPFLRQGWLSSEIDLWEDNSDFVIYDTEEQAKEAAKKFKNKYSSLFSGKNEPGPFGEEL